MTVKLQDLEETCQEIDKVLNRVVDEAQGKNPAGFTLVIFDFAPEGHTTYVSNAKNQDMIQALEELLALLKAATIT